MDIKKVGRRFYQSYQKEDGSMFKGLIGKPSMTGRYSNYTVVGTVLFTGPETTLSAGDVFFSKFGQALLCLDNANEETLGRTQLCYTIKLMNRKLSWKRPQKVVDPVSGMEMDSEKFEELGDIYCSLEADGKTSDSVQQISYKNYVVITNKDLKPNDILNDNMVVTSVDTFLGVVVANIQRR